MSHSKHEVDIDHQFHRYDGAGHGFQDFHNPSRWRPNQTADSCDKLFAYYDSQLES